MKLKNYFKDKIICDTCVGKRICKMRDLYENTDLKLVTKHPYLNIEIRCAEYKYSRAKLMESKRESPLKFIVKEWRQNNPSGLKVQCHRDTGISRPTVDKYWEE